MENSRINHYAKNEAARQIKPRKKVTNDKTTTGYLGQTTDMPERTFEIARNIELAKLEIKRLTRNEILAETYGQKYNGKWLEARKKIINCSYFGRIVNSKSPQSKSYSKMVYDILYTESEFANTAELRHQRLYEEAALKMFVQVHKKHELQQTGLFIDQKFGFLGVLI